MFLIHCTLRSRAFVALGFLGLVPMTFGQSVPTDLLDLSLEALLAAPVVEGERHGGEATPRWHLSYSFQYSHFENYYDGNTELSKTDLLWNPKEGPRGDNEYLAVTPEISQDVHALTLGYDLDFDNTITVVVPWIHQATRHQTIIPGYEQFEIETDNLGDVSVLWDRTFARSLNSHWLATLGVSVPTGSIDETGPTPQGPNSALPYTMQMGSGTWDIPIALTYVRQSEAYRWGVGGKALYRIGENDRDYTLGNRVGVSLWGLASEWAMVEPGLKLTWEWQDSIDGAANNLPRPDPLGRYPTPVVNADNYGGQRVEAGAFARFFFNAERHQHVDLEFSLPVYQDLNGPQVANSYRLGIRLGMEF